MIPSSQAYAGDPAAIVASVEWIERALLGTAATAVAIIAVAAVGFSMLSGYVSVRRGATVIVGCFILFAAPSIAAALKAFAVTDGKPEPYVAEVYEKQRPAPTPPPSNYDPYAGPAVQIP